MRILLATPRGFCAGVTMAVEALNRALEQFGTPLYVYHEIVHNDHVVAAFSGKGVVFVQSLDDVPFGSRLLYSAHGVSPQIREQAASRKLQTIDATCPLVTKVHDEVRRYAQAGYIIYFIGHEEHDEVVGTMGVAPEVTHLVQTPQDVAHLRAPLTKKLVCLTQTTLSVDDARQIFVALQTRFPTIETPAKDDICYATQNRQEVIARHAKRADFVLVVGSQSSSNSRRLVDVARAHGKPSRLIEDAGALDCRDLDEVETLLLTAGASAPEPLVDGVIEYLQREFKATVEEVHGAEERVVFPLPLELRPRREASPVA
jgi:4-hydroxy-3-methylbut-2-enyl diphosphate reductase